MKENENMNFVPWNKNKPFGFEETLEAEDHHGWTGEYESGLLKNHFFLFKTVETKGGIGDPIECYDYYKEISDGTTSVLFNIYIEEHMHGLNNYNFSVYRNDEEKPFYEGQVIKDSEFDRDIIKSYVSLSNADFTEQKANDVIQKLDEQETPNPIQTKKKPKGLSR